MKFSFIIWPFLFSFYYLKHVQMLLLFFVLIYISLFYHLSVSPSPFLILHLKLVPVQNRAKVRSIVANLPEDRFHKLINFRLFVVHVQAPISAICDLVTFITWHYQTQIKPLQMDTTSFHDAEKCNKPDSQVVHNMAWLFDGLYGFT